MKITNNVAGNYNPYAIKNTVPKDAVPKQIVTKAAENISTEEKNFFARLYPEKKSEIIDYHFYQRSGEMKGVSIGSTFDRRG
ncbi:MAG: hypothetical protein V1720_01115 [bacterium]